MEAPRLFLDQDFDSCRAGAYDSAFEPGALLGGVDPSDDSFKIDAIEVWGMGGEDAQRMQAKARSDHERMIMNQRKVDKKAFADNSFDREFLLKSTFGHQTGERKTGS